jgi:hypothetical protein
MLEAEAATTVKTKAATVRTDERMNLRMIASPLNQPGGARHLGASYQPQAQASSQTGNALRELPAKCALGSETKKHFGLVAKQPHALNAPIIEWLS